MSNREQRADDPPIKAQEEPIRIHELRASRLRFAALPTLVTAETTPGSLGARVARQAGYEAEITAALANTGELTVPWVPGTGLFNNFWRLYLEGPPDDLSPARAWKLFVPLRLAIVARSAKPAGSSPRLYVVTDGFAGRLRLEAYAYPHGVALLSTVYLAGDFDLDQAVDAVIEADKALAFQVVVDDRSDVHRYRLPLLEERLLQLLVARMTGTASAVAASDPFLVTTVIRGEGAQLDEPVEDQGELHRALHGLCSRKRRVPPPLAELRLDGSTSSPSDLLYAPEDERMVWIPSAQAAGARRQTVLGCYHRNLVQLSLQVGSLLAAAEMGAESLRAHNGIPHPRLHDLARRSVDVLGRLYGKSAPTYHSASAPRQIEEHGRAQAVDMVRKFNGLAPLHR